MVQDTAIVAIEVE